MLAGLTRSDDVYEVRLGRDDKPLTVRQRLMKAAQEQGRDIVVRKSDAGWYVALATPERRSRRVPVSFVDVAARPPAPAELRRFLDRFGAAALIDPTSRVYRDGGLAYLALDEAEMAERLTADARLLRLPLVRDGRLLSVGHDEAALAEMIRQRGVG